MAAIRDINSLKVSSLQPTQTPVDVTSEQESNSIMQSVHKNEGLFYTGRSIRSSPGARLLPLSISQYRVMILKEGITLGFQN